MLRITQSNQNDPRSCVKLEGKLLAPWVDEVDRLFNGIGGPVPARLDLSGLTFVDAAGAALLQRLLQRGVQIGSCAPYVAELLQWARNKNH